MKTVSFYDLKITDGFWADKQKLNKETTLWAVYEQFEKTGRISTMDCRRSDTNRHLFYASDVFKWVEGAAYILEETKDEKLLKAVNEIVDMVDFGCLEDGYYNSYFNSPQIEEERFTNRDRHELYTFGHMFEAGVALYHATGNEKLLNICRRSAELIYRIFVEEDSASFVTPGHEEIELALVKLYQATGEKNYLELSEFFVMERGKHEQKDATNFAPEYSQSQAPVTEQEEAVGHAVRAVYLYAAIADLAAEKKDKQLFDAAERLFTDIYKNKMYITGGIGSVAVWECFSTAYHLPNQMAYAETCAALGLALFCRRMYAMVPDGRYGDVAERALLNGMMSGVSLSGDAFFYVNPLEVDLERIDIPKTKVPLTQRQKVFSCSCCPPNLVRLIPSIGDFIYTYDEQSLYIHQYIANEGIVDGKHVLIETKYPVDGNIKVTYAGEKKLVLRKPGWCDEVITETAYKEKQGYLYFETNTVEIEFVMKPVFYESSYRVHENTGRVALMRGPVVYCVEEQDQDYPIFRTKVDTSEPVIVTEEMYGGLPILCGNGICTDGTEELYTPLVKRKEQSCKLKFIPYYTFANRGEDNMQVWMMK